MREHVRARPLTAIAMKGIAREVVPYAVEGLIGEVSQRPQVISEHATGLDLFLDIEVIDATAAARARRLLESALTALDELAKRAEAASR